jgi:hypothetical protein
MKVKEDESNYFLWRQDEIKRYKVKENLKGTNKSGF